MPKGFFARVIGAVIIIFGRPGSGKDKQSSLLVEWLENELGRDNLSLLVCSQLLTWRQKANDGLANRLAHASFHRREGSLMPVELVCEVVAENFESLPLDHTAVLNGFPRSYEQGKDLRFVIGPRPIVAINLLADRDVCSARISGRQDGRVDDNPDIVRKRQDIYDQTLPGLVQAFQENRVPILEVDGNGGIEDIPVIQKRIQESLYSFFTLPAEKHGGVQSFSRAQVAM